MVFYMIGLGLGGNPDDITMKGYNMIQNADIIYLESYTSILCGYHNNPNDMILKLESYYFNNSNNKEDIINDDNDETNKNQNQTNNKKKSILLADRDLIELYSEERIIIPAKELCVVLLIVGDPFSATTHHDLYIRCIEHDVKVEVIHNASIINGVGITGLQLYYFGQTVSIPFFTDHNNPHHSIYERIEYNRNGNLHTLCLLDIKVKEPDYEKMIQKHSTTITYLPPTYMTINTAAEQLINMEELIQKNAYTKDSLCVGVARIGHTSQKIVAGTLQELSILDMGPPLHSFIICAAQLHDIEYDMIQQYLLPNTTYIR